MLNRFVHAIVVVAALGTTSAAFAHAHLLAQAPAANSTVPAPQALRLGFSEGVEPAFTKVTVTRDGAAVGIQGVAIDPADNKQLIVTPAQPLAPGHYQVKWHAVSVDTHQSDGTYEFEVAP